MKISLIVATGKNGEIGLKNRLLWHIPGDLKYFKTLTVGHPLIMGRNTFESIGRALPERVSIVISSQEQYREKISSIEHCIGVSSLEEALATVKTLDNSFLTHPYEPFITGGGQVYREAMDKNLADTVYLTTVNSSFQADTFFPLEKLKGYTETWREEHPINDGNAFDFTYKRLNKI